MYVVYYHNVVEGAVSDVDRRSSRLASDRFLLQMTFLQEHFRTIALPEYVDRLRSGHLDPSCVSVTFDDAYAGVGEVAAPILARLGIPAAVFAISGTLAAADRLLHYEELEAALTLTQAEAVAAPELGFEKLRIASDKSRALFLKRVKTALKGRPEAERADIQGALLERLGVASHQLSVNLIPRARKMDSTALRALSDSGLWTVGGHTRSHRVLAQLMPEDCRSEIEGCRGELQEALGEAPRFLAYPYGKPEHVGDLAPGHAAEAGFEAAFTTVPGANGAEDDLYRLKRVEFIDLMAAAPPSVQEQARRVFRPALEEKGLSR